MTEANISWVTDQIATGGDLSYDEAKAARQIDELLGMDIDLIIDCRAEATDYTVWEHSHVDYLWLPTNDAYGWSIPAEHFDAAVEKAKPVIDGGGKVFVHCHMGINRGPSTALALLLEQGVPAPRAFDLIRTARPQAGLVYAEDALKAHLKRKRVSKAAAVKRLHALKHHIKTVMTDKERRNISRIIRQNHENDRVELQAARV